MFVQAHPGHFGIGVGHARDDAGVNGLALAFFGKLFVALQFTGNHLSCYLRFVNRLARQHGLAQDVANRKYVQYLGAHLGVDVDEARSVTATPALSAAIFCG